MSTHSIVLSYTYAHHRHVYYDSLESHCQDKTLYLVSLLWAHTNAKIRLMVQCWGIEVTPPFLGAYTSIAYERS